MSGERRFDERLGRGGGVCGREGGGVVYIEEGLGDGWGRRAKSRVEIEVVRGGMGRDILM